MLIACLLQQSFHVHMHTHTNSHAHTQTQTQTLTLFHTHMQHGNSNVLRPWNVDAPYDGQPLVTS